MLLELATGWAECLTKSLLMMYLLTGILLIPALLSSLLIVWHIVTWLYISSAADGPDLLLEELDLVRNMDLAVKEERYTDAGNNKKIPSSDQKTHQKAKKREYSVSIQL